MKFSFEIASLMRQCGCVHNDRGYIARSADRWRDADLRKGWLDFVGNKIALDQRPTQ